MASICSGEIEGISIRDLFTWIRDLFTWISVVVGAKRGNNSGRELGDPRRSLVSSARTAVASSF